MDIWVTLSFRWLKESAVDLCVQGLLQTDICFSSVNAQEGNCFILFALLRGTQPLPISVISGLPTVGEHTPVWSQAPSPLSLLPESRRDGASVAERHRCHQQMVEERGQLRTPVA